MAAYDRGDYATNVNEWRPLADQGDRTAQHHLAWLYLIGRGVPQDNEEAVRWSPRPQTWEIVTLRPIWEVFTSWGIESRRIKPKP